MVKSFEAVQPVPFGSYQLVERLAMGGMAEVYLARPDGQPRFVALKRILPNIAADDEFIAMFIDEAKIAGQLNHPNVAAIYDLGKINNSYFIAMEYVSGHDLRAMWDRTRDNGENNKPSLPISLACYVVKRICDGLDYAHRRRDAKGRPLGIIHRDVSPQNILVSYDGDLKIIDFGIAKAANRIVKTQTGILKGKFAYMAPEQARGEPTDHRADIFAIGVILYELLTGERAFKADSDFALLEKVRRVDLPAPRTLRPELPKDLERIVYKALAKEAADRYAWASALGADLDRFMSDQGYASSKEELGGFLQRTFKEELKEEQKRLAAYRSLFSDLEDESASATVLRGSRPGSNPEDRRSNERKAAATAAVSLDSDARSDESRSSSADEGTAMGDSVDDGESNVATSFEEGGPTSASVAGQLPSLEPRNAKKPANGAAAANGKNANGSGGNGAGNAGNAVNAGARLASSFSVSAGGAGGGSTSPVTNAKKISLDDERDPPREDSDEDADEIDASEEASALGDSVSTSLSMQASDTSQASSNRSLDASLSSGMGGLSAAGVSSSTRPPRPRGRGDETQLDVDAPPAAPPPPPPSVVSRDEVPKKLRVVSARGPNDTSSPGMPPAPKNMDDSRRSETDRVRGQRDLEQSDRSERNERSERSERNERNERNERSERSERSERNDRDREARDRRRNDAGERSSLSRAQVRPPPAQQPLAPVLIAAFLGVVIGAGVVGIGWLATAKNTASVVFVVTPRQAEVREGDVVLCAQTPCAVDLEPGKHEIRFRAPGADELSRNVEVKLEGNAPIEVVLERTRDDIRLSTNPPGAIVALDDRVLPGTTPMTLPKLVVGAGIRLKLQREGFEPLEANRIVDDEAEWRYDLPTSTTEWTVTADPVDALIEGPGKDLPGKLISVVGKKNVSVRVQRPGCQPKEVKLYATGRAKSQEKVTLDCRRLDSGFVLKGRKLQVRVDGTDIPRSAKLEPYPLPAGTWTINLRNQRGKTETHTVELTAGKYPVIPTKLR